MKKTLLLNIDHILNNFTEYHKLIAINKYC